MSDLEAKVRQALTRRLRYGRVPEAPAWDDECVAAIMGAVAESEEMCVTLALLEDGTVEVASERRPGSGLSFTPAEWAVLAGAVKAGEYDDYVTEPLAPAIETEPETQAAGGGKADPVPARPGRSGAKRPAAAAKVTAT
jgi:hypothetical protein